MKRDFTKYVKPVPCDYTPYTSKISDLEKKISDADAKAAAAVIEKSLAKTISQITIDSRHRAGFALRIGDRRIDATLRGQLQRLRTTLLR